MRGDTVDDGEWLRIRRDPAGPVVLAPLIGAAWLSRDRRYWRRRIAATVIVALLWGCAVVLSIVFARGIARSGTLTSEVLAGCYALLGLPGGWLGRRWVRRAPAAGSGFEDGLGGPLSVLLVVFMPVLAGAGVAVLPRLLLADLPGERRARELTAVLRARAPAS